MLEQRFRILLVEDNPGDAFLVRTLLEETTEPFDIEHCGDLGSAMAILNGTGDAAQFDVILLDLTLPDSSGVETISRIRSCANAAPVVVLTGHKDEELAFEALQHGAEDYLTKEFPDGRTIRRSIRYAIERSRSERALKESEERYRKLVELAPELIAVLSGEEIVYINQQGLSMLRVTDAQMLGHSFMEMVHETSREILAEHIDRYKNGYSGRADFTLMCLRRDGENVELEVSAIAFTHEGAPAMLMLAEDVTEKRKIERQLVQTSKLATLGEMAASIAHEMNQPLNVIRMAADTCSLQYDMDAVKPAFQRERLKLISGQTERMSEIIKHLQIYSRPDNDDFELFDPMKALGRAVDMIEHDCRLSGILIDVVPPTQLCMVKGRQVQLEQVLVNILTNARDAINENGDDGNSIGGLIRISAVIDAQTQTLRIAINDNGGGVPEAAIDFLFHPFFTTKDVGKGTGLGLSVSYGIVEAMGGKINVRNEGDGACFEIALPVVEIGMGELPHIEDDDGLDDDSESTVSTADRQKVRVLVVDDEMDAMEIISAYLEGQGYNVCAASNGEEALAIAGAMQPDILITDIRMPQMDGNSLVKELRSRNPAMPVIVMTGHPGDAHRPDDDEDGTDAPVMVMSKPLGLRELLSVLDELAEVFCT
ncbi:response regulator [Thalassospira sp. MA62]|nr:response regulator [Thalassospira sp. MA62]